MSTIKPDFKDQFAKKILEFQLNGLEQYAKYLKQQLKIADQHEHWEIYKKYIEKETIRNNKKIISVKEKIK